jgi:YD repeat-containing protein
MVRLHGAGPLFFGARHDKRLRVTYDGDDRIGEVESIEDGTTRTWAYSNEDGCTDGFVHSAPLSGLIDLKGKVSLRYTPSRTP